MTILAKLLSLAADCCHTRMDFFSKKSFGVHHIKGKRKRLRKKNRKSNFQQQPPLDHFMWKMARFASTNLNFIAVQIFTRLISSPRRALFALLRVTEGRLTIISTRRAAKRSFTILLYPCENVCTC